MPRCLLLLIMFLCADPCNIDGASSSALVSSPKMQGGKPYLKFSEECGSPSTSLAMVDQKPMLPSTACEMIKSEGKRLHTLDERKNAKKVKRTPTESYDIILTTYSIIWRDLSDLQKKHFGKLSYKMYLHAKSRWLCNCMTGNVNRKKWKMRSED